MNIEKLEAGITFKNYKELCTVLGMKIESSTNSKTAQMKELSRYCRYSKMGHKISIEEVYEVPQEKIDNRGGVSVYRETVQLLITDLLAQCESGHISISRSKLMLTIGMVNENYSDYRELVSKLSDHFDIDENFIYDFYNTSTSSFRSIIESALDDLMDKRILHYQKVVKVSYKNNFGTKIADENELKIITEIEKDVLEEMGFKRISAVRVSSHWKKFRLKVKKLLQLATDIDFYFTAYDITINEKYILNERNELAQLLLEKLKREETCSKLNQIIYDNVLKNAQTRHEKGFTSTPRMAKYRLDKKYVENIRLLANSLIDEDCPSILGNLKAASKEAVFEF